MLYFSESYDSDLNSYFFKKVYLRPCTTYPIPTYIINVFFSLNTCPHKMRYRVENL